MFHSFQVPHMAYMIAPLASLRLSLGSPAMVSSHQEVMLRLAVGVAIPIVPHRHGETAIEK